MSKRILIFNVNWLGDILFSTATIRNIRRNFSNSFIACIIPTRGYQILKGNPYLDEIIIFDEREKQSSIFAKIRFIQILKRKNFDTVFLLHRSFSRALICWLAGIAQRIGYYTKKRGLLLTQKILPPAKDSLHRIDYYLNIIQETGIKVEDRYLDFFIADKDLKFVEDFLNKELITPDDFLVGINPAGNWLPKRWPKEYWVSFSDRLIRDFGAKVIVTGGPADITLAFEIKKLMQEKPIIACGIFNLKQFGALCKRLNLFITGDTGPLHIANTMNTKKIIALFGPTSPEITGPYPLKNVIILKKDIGCKIPCYVVNCRDNRCMKAIMPEEVIEKIRLS
jgi:heptosyltransferase-2/heptosyltransferase-3